MKIAIDLLWIRPQRMGGVESYTRNLLRGLLSSGGEHTYLLLCTRDNASSFSEWANHPAAQIVICRVKAAFRTGRILYQNLVLPRLCRRLQADLCLVPHYYLPRFRRGGAKYISTVHDLQAFHVPETTSRLRVMWMKYCLRYVLFHADCVVLTSEFVREDVIAHFPAVPSDRLTVIPPVIEVGEERLSDGELASRYGVTPGDYYMTVSSTLRHKNLPVLLAVMRRIKEEDLPLPRRLLIAGVGGNRRAALAESIVKEGLTDAVTLLPFIPGVDRDTLCARARAFLFPSLFEGFGMPPVEAMLLGTPAVTTPATSIPEATCHAAIYVEDTQNPAAWTDVLEKCPPAVDTPAAFNRYRPEAVAAAYLALFAKIEKESPAGFHG